MKTHGHAARTGMSSTYRSWRAMKRRVLSDPDKKKYYADKGIKICTRWFVFKHFLTDMGERPAGMTIERIDNAGDYGPGNCRWATRKEQCQNRGTSRLITHEGETLCLCEWARRVGIGWSTIRRRLEMGWPTHRALTQPVRGSG